MMRLTTQDYKPGLGKREASLIAGLAEAGRTIFTADDARAITHGEVNHLGKATPAVGRARRDHPSEERR